MHKKCLLKENEPKRSAAYKQLYRLPKNLLPRKFSNKKMDTLCINSRLWT